MLMMASLIKTIPELDCGSTTLKEFCDTYTSTCCVVFRDSITHTKKRRRRLDTRHHLESLLNTFQSASPKDQESWCVETAETNSCIKPTDFLSPSHKQHQDGYCSFILQDDTNQTISTFTDSVEESIFPILILQDDDSAASSNSNSIQTSRPIWIFVGHNSSKKTPLEGRSEHTDNIQHDGTVHYQVSGTKTWYIRPTQELRDLNKNNILEDSYKVTLSEGDRIVINTRLWWHRTEIPPQDNDDNVSISYAQDIYLDGRKVPKEGTEEEEVMSNVEGAWAMGFIPKGTQLLTDSSSVDELPMQRTNDIDKANCKLVVVSEEGEQPVQRAVVTLRDIQESEFFILLNDKQV